MEASITPNFGLIQLLIVLGSLALGVFAGGWLVGLKIQKLIKTGKLLRVEDHENTMRELVSNLRFGHNVNETNQEYDKLFNHGIAQQQLAADLRASENAENAPITFRPEPINKRQAGEYDVMDDLFGHYPLGLDTDRDSIKKFLDEKKDLPEQPYVSKISFEEWLKAGKALDDLDRHS